jgi:hypothetical protein
LINGGGGFSTIDAVVERLVMKARG